MQHHSLFSFSLLNVKSVIHSVSSVSCIVVSILMIHPLYNHHHNLYQITEAFLAGNRGRQCVLFPSFHHICSWMSAGAGSSSISSSNHLCFGSGPWFPVVAAFCCSDKMACSSLSHCFALLSVSIVKTWPFNPRSWQHQTFGLWSLQIFSLSFATCFPGVFFSLIPLWWWWDDARPGLGQKFDPGLFGPDRPTTIRAQILCQLTLMYI